MRDNDTNEEHAGRDEGKRRLRIYRRSRRITHVLQGTLMTVFELLFCDASHYA
jgi:hypothetical protein